MLCAIDSDADLADLQTPQVIERAEQDRLTRATKLIQRWWRRRRWQQSAERSRRKPRPSG